MPRENGAVHAARARSALAQRAAPLRAAASALRELVRLKLGLLGEKSCLKVLPAADPDQIRR